MDQVGVGGVGQIRIDAAVPNGDRRRYVQTAADSLVLRLCRERQELEDDQYVQPGRGHRGRPGGFTSRRVLLGDRHHRRHRSSPLKVRLLQSRFFSVARADLSNAPLD